MDALVIGYMPCDFEDKSGNQVQGVKLRYAYDTRKQNYVGQEIGSVWIPQKMINEMGFTPQPGEVIDLYFEVDGDKNYFIGYSSL